ncbi:helix-turn-helix domain-containing protein [Diaminobutyricimonas sp. LJ205]|uniref:helix-turn-helix domain-containing protein n=1 Tax=Diaminobutyricimonas sp. LJ205 TaxID=2683590 RepID=UPI0012F51E6E|nr:helix-turn-helix domain-containing protein [Diaminobutyricimonas sp. LJ205]
MSHDLVNASTGHRQKVSKPEVLIKAVTVLGFSYGQTAKRYGVSKTLVHRLHHRWLEEGDQAFQARSSRPKTQPARTPDSVRDRVLQLREHLTRDGLDAGADTIHTHLTAEGHQLSRATVWRILKRAGRITPQPQKRPRSSYIRFNADRPNQMWQSDFTHWTCADGTEVEIIGWLDDHSRFLLHLSAHHRVTGKTVTDTFTHTATATASATATATRPPRSPRTATTTPRDTPAAARDAAAETPSKPSSPWKASPRKTVAPTDPPPKARSNASGRP